MRPTGVLLIALYHALSAFFLLMVAAALAVGGTVLGAMLAAGHSSLFGGLGIAVGVLGAIFFLAYALIAAIAAYGIWALREWGRIMSIVLAVISLLFSLPGLLMMGAHLNLFFGGYRLARIAISGLIVWYLVQPHVKAVFRRAPAAPPA
ncbi:MAG TPA: hypothetical protein VKB58_04220 [Terriglobales bacterium]|jgi:hypothetical protein|nr:hypothetical protein [Terriglobales bacterium]